jgi:MFS transporter, OFA family, oxalate/formate antiporter
VIDHGAVTASVFLFLTIVAGAIHSEILFVVTAILAIFFWAPLFSLFPAVIGQYYGAVAAGSNYGILYTIAKSSSGLYGGVLSAILITIWVLRRLGRSVPAC